MEINQVLDYRIRRPLKEGGKTPILFLLHGYGSHEEDLYSFANYLPEEYLIISLRAPLTLGFGGYAWYSIHFNEQQDKWSDDAEAKRAQEIILYNIDYHLEQFKLEGQKVSLLGFSQGAILSWAVGLSHPERIDKIIALSGYVNEDIFGYAKEGLDQLRIFSSHGTEDPTLPVDWARKGIALVEKKDLKVEYKEYPAGHSINPENFADLLAWLKTNT
ncbi:MAG: phospholipase [Flavobacteriaceae bacterium]|jgi:phospholipase/carboxylesterase|nr:phospholipase [Flavobacteriaceae bacterium]